MSVKIVLWILTALYLIGKFSNRTYEIPSFIRWHLADFGIVGALCLFCWGYLKMFDKTDREIIEANRIYAWIFACVCAFYELLQAGFVIADIDWIDVSMYFIGALIVFLSSFGGDE
jgi:hypothetical protein